MTQDLSYFIQIPRISFEEPDRAIVVTIVMIANSFMMAVVRGCNNVHSNTPWDNWRPTYGIGQLLYLLDVLAQFFLCTHLRRLSFFLEKPRNFSLWKGLNSHFCPKGAGYCIWYQRVKRGFFNRTLLFLFEIQYSSHRLLDINEDLDLFDTGKFLACWSYNFFYF